MANHMEEVAKMLGVELGERFQIVNLKIDSPISEYNFYFTEKNIVIDVKGCDCDEAYILGHLIYGDYTIKRKPWKPKAVGEMYYYVAPSGDAIEATWQNALYNLNAYKLGNCYRTLEKAEANRDKWVQFYASDEVLEV